MTRDELRILAMLTPQPKLEWQQDPRYPDMLNLWVGQLYCGEVRPRNGKFEGISYILGLDIRAQDVGIEEAKAAVEEAVRKALGMSND